MALFSIPGGGGGGGGLPWGGGEISTGKQPQDRRPLLRKNPRNCNGGYGLEPQIYDFYVVYNPRE